MGAETLGAVAEIVMGQSPPGETVNERRQGLPLLNGPTEFGPHHPAPVQFTTDVRKTAQPRDILFCVRGSTNAEQNVPWLGGLPHVGRELHGRRMVRPKLRRSVEKREPLAPLVHCLTRW